MRKRRIGERINRNKKIIKGSKIRQSVCVAWAWARSRVFYAVLFWFSFLPTDLILL